MTDRQQHDQFVELFIRNQNRIFRFILTLTPNRDDAEEIFQQTSLTIWKIWDRFDPEQDFTRWACGVAHNHVRNHMRKNRGLPSLLSDDLLELVANTWISNNAWLEQRRTALAECLDSLPDEQRQLLERRYRGIESITEIAARRGQSANAVYKLLGRIRAALHECISRRLEREAES